MRARLLLLAVFSLILASLTGCTPTVQLKSATLRGPDLNGLVFDANLEINNPNTFDVQVRAVRANVRIENVNGVVPIDAKPDRWVPADSTAMLAVPFTIPWAMIPSVLASTLTDPEITYKVIGWADVTATQTFKIEKDMYKFDQEGTLPRRLFVNVSPTGILNLGVGQ